MVQRLNGLDQLSCLCSDRPESLFSLPDARATFSREMLVKIFFRPCAKNFGSRADRAGSVLDGNAAAMVSIASLEN